MLTVLDGYTREALCVSVNTRMGTNEVLEALYSFLLKQGKPKFIRFDDGPEFIATALQLWLTKVCIKPMQIYLGPPWEIGYNKRFNETLRHEVLDAEWLTTTKQVLIVINKWLMQ